MASSMEKPNRVVRSDGVQVGGGDVAVFSELAFIPSRTGDPFANFGKSDLSLYASNDLSDRSGVRELDAVKFRDTSLSDMRVCVNQAGSSGVTVQIDDADTGSIPCELQNFAIAPDFHDDAMADSDGLGYRVLGIQGEDVAVKQEKVSAGVRREDSSRQQNG